MKTGETPPSRPVTVLTFSKHLLDRGIRLRYKPDNSAREAP